MSHRNQNYIPDTDIVQIKARIYLKEGVFAKKMFHCTIVKLTILGNNLLIQLREVHYINMNMAVFHFS